MPNKTPLNIPHCLCLSSLQGELLLGIDESHFQAQPGTEGKRAAWRHPPEGGKASQSPPPRGLSQGPLPLPSGWLPTAVWLLFRLPVAACPRGPQSPPQTPNHPGCGPSPASGWPAGRCGAASCRPGCSLPLAGRVPQAPARISCPLTGLLNPLALPLGPQSNLGTPNACPEFKSCLHH